MSIEPRSPGPALFGSRGDVIPHTTELPAAWITQAAGNIARQLARRRPRTPGRRRRLKLNAIRRLLCGKPDRSP